MSHLQPIKHIDIHLRQKIKNFNYSRACWIIIAIGIILRLAQYIYNRSLTEGEAALALNIVHRSYSELLRPLDFTQAAPIGFLFIEKFFFNVMGNNEYALRLFPLISGIFGIFLFFKLTKKFLGKTGSLLALLLFAVGDHLIYFSSEVKQYSSDVLIALVIILTALYVIEKRFSFKSLLCFNIIGAVLLWFSHPALFVLSAAVLVFLLNILRKKQWPLFIRVLFFSIIPAISFIINYHLSLRAISQNPELITGWQRAFLPLIPGSIKQTVLSGYSFLKIFKTPLGIPVYELFLTLCCFIIGAVYMYYKQRNKSLLLLIPLILTIIASSLHRYPFAGRLLLFLVPLMLIPITEGVIFLSRNTARGSILAALVLPFVLTIGPCAIASYHLIKPRAPEELRPVLKYLRKERKNSDTIYLYYASINAYNYYKEFFNLTGPVIYGNPSRENWSNYLEQIKRLKGRNRVWFLFSHICTRFGVDEEKLFISYLDILGSQIKVYKAPGASAYLYDLGD